MDVQKYEIRSNDVSRVVLVALNTLGSRCLSKGKAIYMSFEKTFIRRIAHILTISEPEANELLRQHEGDACCLEKWFDEVTNSKEGWTGAALYALPLGHILKQTRHTSVVSEYAETSFSFLRNEGDYSKDESVESAKHTKQARQMQARLDLVRSLSMALPAHLHEKFGEAFKCDTLRSYRKFYPGKPANEDINFLNELVILEAWFTKYLKFLNDAATSIDQGRGMLPSFERYLMMSEVASDTVKSIIDDCATTGIQNQQDSLYVRVMANVCVNRVILEFGALQRNQQRAACACVSLFSQFEKYGISAIPEEILKAKDEGEVFAVMEALLTEWFAPRTGSLLDTQGPFSKAMTSRDRQKVFECARALEATRNSTPTVPCDVTTENANGVAPEFVAALKGAEAHLRNIQTFSCSLALVAAFYSQVDLPPDAYAEKNRVRAFPSVRRTLASRSTDMGEKSDDDEIFEPSVKPFTVQQEKFYLSISNLLALTFVRFRNFNTKTLELPSRELSEATGRLIDILAYAVKNRPAREIAGVYEGLIATISKRYNETMKSLEKSAIDLQARKKAQANAKDSVKVNSPVYQARFHFPVALT